MIADFEVVLSLSMLQKKYFVFEQIVLFCISLQCGLNKFDGGTRKSIFQSREDKIKI